MERYHNFEEQKSNTFYLGKNPVYTSWITTLSLTWTFFLNINKVCTISAKVGNYICKKNQEKRMYSQRLLSQIWLLDMQLRTGCSHKHKIPRNMYHETLPIRSELHYWFIKIQYCTQTSTFKWNLLKNGSFWLKQHEVLSCLLYSSPLPGFLQSLPMGKVTRR